MVIASFILQICFVFIVTVHIVVQLLSRVTLCNPMDCSRPGSSVLRYFLEFAQIHVHWVGDTKHLTSHPLLSPSPFAFSLSQHWGLFSESALRIRWPKYWSSSFSVSPSNEHSGLISFRIVLVWSPCHPRDSEESSPAPQFEIIKLFILGVMMQWCRKYKLRIRIIKLVMFMWL